MTTPDPTSPRRYRRRILGLGAAAFIVAFAVGAAIFVPVVQNDLTERVEAEFDEAGLDGVTASFSGQDGTLTCENPFDDPAAAEALGEDVRGVRVLDLDDSCTPGTSESEDPAAPDVTDAPVTDPADTTTASTGTGDTIAETTTTSEAPPPTEPQADGILAIIDGDPLFGQLAGLIETAGLDGDDALGGDGPITLLAPTDAAFDAAFEALEADGFSALASDPEALRAVLLHHVTEGAIASDDFVAGDLQMLDGTSVTVDPDGVDGITFTSNGVSAGVADPETQLDIVASNGVVHAIDRLLIPEGLDLGDPSASVTSASYAAGRITLGGVVQTEEQRAALVAAASTDVDPVNVVDELTVDAQAAVAQVDLDRFATIVGIMPLTLLDGDAELDGTRLTLTGTALDDATQTLALGVASDNDVTAELSPRQVADEASARALQTELNDFVTANPILFEPNSATITADASSVIDQLANRARRLEGTNITIIGHTDSDGSPGTNQLLSEQRAASVLQALGERGVDVATLSSEGRGSAEPVLDATGVEDKAASRRVEFVVEAV